MSRPRPQTHPISHHRRRQRGSAVLYVIVLSPVLLLSLALAVEVGALQLQKQRLHSALDQSVVVASSVGARAHSIADLDTQKAVAVERVALTDNLEPLQTVLAAGATPAQIAQDADVVVITDVPSIDPLGNGSTLRQPTIEARMRAPVRTGLLAAAGLPGTTVLTLTANADLHFAGVP